MECWALFVLFLGIIGKSVSNCCSCVCVCVYACGREGAREAYIRHTPFATPRAHTTCTFHPSDQHIINTLHTHSLTPTLTYTHTHIDTHFLALSLSQTHADPLLLTCTPTLTNFADAYTHTHTHTHANQIKH